MPEHILFYSMSDFVERAFNKEFDLEWQKE
jgi:hypothetical protein